MNFINPVDVETLISQAEEEHLYFKLIEQVNKDFALANESLDVPSSIFPFEFKNLVQEKIYKLIQYKFAEYLNLLYIIDVPEEQIKKHYPEIYDKVLTQQVSICEDCFRQNIIKGIHEGLYRENLDIDNYVKFYYTLIFNINENTILEKDAHELELKALEYHIRAMATLAGIIELEKHLKNPII